MNTLSRLVVGIAVLSLSVSAQRILPATGDSPAVSLPTRAPSAAPTRVTDGSPGIAPFFVDAGSESSGPRFVLRGSNLTASLETGLLRWTIHGSPATQGSACGTIVIEPLGCRPAVAPRGEDPLPGVVSSFRGTPSHWQTGRPTCRRVRYAGLWDGVDLLMEADGPTLKSTYEIAAGADPAVVRMRHHGAGDAFIDDIGRLVMETAAGPLIDAAPRAWQEVDGERREIPVGFALTTRPGGDVDVGFTLGAHDPDLPVQLDPAVVVQAGFLGGTERDEILDVAVDDAGYVYVCGWARSDETSFPVIVGPSLIWSGAWAPWGDAFVAKLDPTGNTLLYAGYIGGWDDEFATGIAVDGAGRAYVAGHSSSSETEGFPVVGGPDLTQSGSLDGWVARVSADGTTLEYCGYVGGTGFEDRVLDVDVDAAGRAYLVGHTDSDEFSFPVSVGPDLVANGSTDAWVARVAADGLSLDYCGYVGGSSGDECTSVVADGTGGAWIAGWTNSDQNSFPVSNGPSTTFNGGSDGFVARVAPDGSSLLWCGYVGGSSSDLVNGLAVDGTGAPYIVGLTWSSDYPAIGGPDLTANGGIDAFVTKVTPDGSGLAWSGYVGGSSTDMAFGVAVDDASGAWIVGGTSSTESSTVPFPVVGGLDDTANGGNDGFVVRVLPSGTGLDFAGFVGGAQTDVLNAVALVPSALTPGVHEAWVGGVTDSTEATFPVVSGPDVTQNGQEDGALVRVQAGPDPWADLGNGLAGTHGVPVCAGQGTLGPNSPVAVTLASAIENATSYFCVGATVLNTPFKGGILVPDISSPGFYFPVGTSPSGTAIVTSTWPPSVPAGLSIYFQWWTQDPFDIYGFSASNGLSGTTP